MFMTGLTYIKAQDPEILKLWGELMQKCVIDCKCNPLCP